MKIIGLIGKSNSGKTSSLKYLMLKILDQKGVEILYSSNRRVASPAELKESIKNNWITPDGTVRDLTIAVKYKNKIIGITSFGDALKHDIIRSLKKVIEKCGRCDIFVCGRHERNILDEEFEVFSPIKTERINHNYTDKPKDYEACNKKSAAMLFSCINENL